MPWKRSAHAVTRISDGLVRDRNECCRDRVANDDRDDVFLHVVGWHTCDEHGRSRTGITVKINETIGTKTTHGTTNIHYPCLYKYTFVYMT